MTSDSSGWASCASLGKPYFLSTQDNQHNFCVPLVLSEGFETVFWEQCYIKYKLSQISLWLDFHNVQNLRFIEDPGKSYTATYTSGNQISFKSGGEGIVSGKKIIPAIDITSQFAQSSVVDSNYGTSGRGGEHSWEFDFTPQKSSADGTLCGRVVLREVACFKLSGKSEADPKINLAVFTLPEFIRPKERYSWKLKSLGFLCLSLLFMVVFLVKSWKLVFLIPLWIFVILPQKQKFYQEKVASKIRGRTSPEKIAASILNRIPGRILLDIGNGSDNYSKKVWKIPVYIQVPEGKSREQVEVFVRVALATDEQTLQEFMSFLGSSDHDPNGNDGDPNGSLNVPSKPNGNPGIGNSPKQSDQSPGQHEVTLISQVIPDIDFGSSSGDVGELEPDINRGMDTAIAGLDLGSTQNNDQDQEHFNLEA